MIFFKEQGYDIRNNYVYQDNESAAKLEINGRNSCTRNSRHVDIKFFWVKDRVDKKEVEIKYCPTTLMLADYFTKPLQGTVFRRFRDVIMGKVHINNSPKTLLEARNLAIISRKEKQFESANRENVNGRSVFLWRRKKKQRKHQR